jgi:hypothetical protein
MEPLRRYPSGMPPQATSLRITSIILVALVAGIATFAGVVLFLRLSSERELDPAVGQLLLITLGLLAVAELPVYFLLRKQFLARVRAMKAEALQLLLQDLTPQPLFSLTIVGAAMVEGLGLLGVMAVLLGAPLYALAAPALAILLILAQIPTRARLEHAVRGE